MPDGRKDMFNLLSFKEDNLVRYTCFPSVCVIVIFTGSAMRLLVLIVISPLLGLGEIEIILLNSSLLFSF